MLHKRRCHNKDKTNSTVIVESEHKCNYFGCSYVGNTDELRCHNKKTKCAETMSVDSDTASVNTVSSKKSVAAQKQTVHKCDYVGCNSIGKNIKSLSMHNKVS